MTAQTVAPLKQQSAYEAELIELRAKEDALFEQALSSPRDEMLNQFVAIWTRRNEIYKAIEMNMTPMPSADNTAKSVNNETCTLEEFLAVPKPGKWKFIRSSFLPPCWIREDAPGRHECLPVSIVRMYKLTPRQILILEGKIKVETETSKALTLHEILESKSIDEGYEKYFDRRSW